MLEGEQIGERSGLTYQDMTAMIFKGGSKDSWVYRNAAGAICVSTTAHQDPCSDVMTFANADDTTLSFGIQRPEVVSWTNTATTSMTSILTLEPGATGFGGQQDVKANTMMNPTEDPMKSVIATGSLKNAYYNVYVTFKKTIDQVIDFRRLGTGVNAGLDILWQGKVTNTKVSLCVGVTYKYTNNSWSLQGSDCVVEKDFAVTECRTQYLGQFTDWQPRAGCEEWKLVALDHIAGQLA